MRCAAIILAAASLASAQDLNNLPTDAAGISAFVTQIFGTDAAVPTNSAEGAAFASSFLNSLGLSVPASLPTDAAGASSYASAVVESALGTIPSITAADETSSIASSISAAVMATTTPHSSSSAPASGSANPQSTGGVAPAPSALGFMIAGGLAAGIAAVAL